MTFLPTNHPIYKIIIEMRNQSNVIIVLIALVCISCSFGEKSDTKGSTAITAPIDREVADDSDLDQEDSLLESLNDIRFADFQEDDWLDNEYIKALRQYVDDFNQGKIEDETLKSYLTAAKGKFVIASVEPALMGGLFIMFTFIDQPDDIFSVWVYSEVDERTKKVTNYTVQGIKHEDMKSGMTKEEILQVVKERPEVKLF